MLEVIREFLSGRRQSYSRVFDTGDDPLGDRQAVLDDLMKFCRFGDSVYHPDQRKTDAMIGRQEVLHRILDYSRLDLEILYGKYAKDKFKPKAGEPDA